MKVLIVSKYFPPVWGGVESNAYYVARYLVRAGHDVTVLASATPGEGYSEKKMSGINVVRIPLLAKIGPAPVSSPRFFSEIMKRDFNVCNLHEPNPIQNFTSFIALMIKRKPYVITYHSDIVPHKLVIMFFKPFYEAFKRLFLLRRARAIAPTSPEYIELSDSLPRFKNKCVVIPNGVDVKKFKPLKRKVEKEKRILFIGRLIYYKGLEYLIKAMPEIIRKVPSASLYIIGEGPLKERLRGLAKELKVDRKIKWMPHQTVEEIIKNYREADVFVLPSVHKTEAFGIVLLEAMACGVPCVGTNISGTSYVLENAGIAVKPKDEGALAKAVIKVLTDEKLAKEMSRKGQAKAQRFSWDNVGEEFEKVYKRVLK